MAANIGAVPGLCFFIRQIAVTVINSAVPATVNALINTASLLKIGRDLAEIVAAFREVVGPRFAVSVRFSADEIIEGGYELDEGVRIAQWLEKQGIDAINVNNADQEHRYYII